MNQTKTFLEFSIVLLAPLQNISKCIKNTLSRLISIQHTNHAKIHLALSLL